MNGVQLLDEHWELLRAPEKYWECLQEMTEWKLEFAEQISEDSLQSLQNIIEWNTCMCYDIANMKLLSEITEDH